MDVCTVPKQIPVQNKNTHTQKYINLEFSTLDVDKIQVHLI